MRDWAISFIFGDGRPVAVAIPFLHCAIGVRSDQRRILGAKGQHLDDLACPPVAAQRVIQRPDRPQHKGQQPPQYHTAQQRDRGDHDHRKGEQDRRRHAILRQRVVRPELQLLHLCVRFCGPAIGHESNYMPQRSDVEGQGVAVGAPARVSRGRACQMSV